jgi:GTP cyclohydrolase IA
MIDQKKLEYYITLMLTEGLGFNLTDPNLSDTPKRITRMYAEEFFINVDKEFDDFTIFPNNKNYDQLIVSENIKFVSICSHHFLPFAGSGFFGYLPDKYVVGLSKLSRVITHYAARPQLQENLTHEILNCFVEKVKPKGAMLVLEASHSCQSSRGAKQPDAMMRTSALFGVLKDDAKAREEMLSALHLIK